MNVTLFFAEGAHDVAFIKLALQYGCGLSVSQGLMINSLPTPLDKIFGQIIKDHFFDDVSLDMAHKFLLPDCAFVSGGNYIFLFNTGGMSKYSVVKKLTSRILYQLKLSGQKYDFSEENLKFVFTYDADYRGENKTIEEVKKNLFPMTVEDCAFDERDSVRDIEVLLDQDSANVNYYIWHGSNGFGSLEDILLPIYQVSHFDLLAKTDLFIAENFPADFIFNPQSTTKHDIAVKADKIKAQITIAGQGSRPSRPGTAIISDNVLGTRNDFVQNPFVSQFVTFLRIFL